jgi:hypothetical protein
MEHRPIQGAAKGLAPRSAQSGGSNFRIGIVGGVNVANAEVTDLDTKALTGFSIGLTGNWKISDVFSIQPEVHYGGKGFKTDVALGGPSVEASFDLRFIDVPVLGRFDFGTAGSARPFLLVDPYLAAKVRCNIKASSGGISATQSCEDAGADIASTDLGAVVGGGLEFPMLGRPWTIGARYQFGVTDLDKESDTSAKNRTIQLLLGVTF